MNLLRILVPDKIYRFKTKVLVKENLTYTFDRVSDNRFEFSIIDRDSGTVLERAELNIFVGDTWNIYEHKS